MSACNACFEVSLGLRSGDQVQGHFLCSPPTEAELVAFRAGDRPELIDNRWRASSARPIKIDSLGRQVWELDDKQFTEDSLA